MYVVFFKVTTFLWLTLILHPDHSNLFLETVRIEFMGPRVRGAEGLHMGPRKTNTSPIACVNINYYKGTNCVQIGRKIEELELANRTSDLNELRN